MRVLLIHNHYQQFGGEDAVVELERSALVQAGINLATYTRHNSDLERSSLVQKALVPLHAIHSNRTARELRECVVDHRPDLAYVHNLYPLISPSAYEVLAEFGIPIVQVVHNFRPYCQNGLLHTGGCICERCLTGSPLAGITHRCFRNNLALSAMYAAATARARSGVRSVHTFITMTEFASGRLQMAGVSPSRIRVRPHYIDAAGALPVYGQGDYALFVGRLSPEKGLWTLLDAFELIPDTALVIAGTGPDEDALRAAVERRRLHNVHFAGFVSGRDKQHLLARSKFVVVPSECYENFPVVILEAFRAGKPVIAARLGGLPYVVEDGHTGHLFTPADAHSLAGHIGSLAAHPDRCAALGRAARRTVEAKYSLDTWLSRTLEIFQSAIGSLAPAPEEALR